MVKSILRFIREAATDLAMAGLVGAVPTIVISLVLMGKDTEMHAGHVAVLWALISGGAFLRDTFPLRPRQQITNITVGVYDQDGDAYTVTYDIKPGRQSDDPS